MKAVSPGQDYAALAKAIEALTEKIDGGASGAAVLAEPARRVPVAGGDRPDLGAAAEPMAEILAELSALTTELKRTRTLALGGGLGSQVEAARSAQIVSTEVDRASTLLRSGQGAEFGRRLWLRSVDEVVDLFGFPSSVSRSDAHLSATWSTADNTVSVIFVDGLVAETKTW